MPLYEYRCDECATHFEQRRAMADADKVTVCPSCNSLLTTRLISVVITIGGGQRENTALPPAITPQKTHRMGCPCCAPLQKRS